MIAASEPLEFIPRGRQAVEEHPGPTVSKQSMANVSATEHLLMHRMQNVNISNEDNSSAQHHEFWSIAELYEGDARMSNFMVNSEQELYFKGNTAVWTRGIGNDVAVLPRKCFTCETPIRHAFFCTEAFIRTDAMDVRMKGGAHGTNGYIAKKDKPKGICLIDKTSLRVYINNGEDFLASLEFPVSHIWSTHFGVLLQKNASSTTISTQTIALPRLFSLSHPLDEMCPVLIRNMLGSLTYLIDSDYTIVFTDPSSHLVLMFDQKTSRHFVAHLRKVTEEEANSICAANDTLNAAEATGHSDAHQHTSMLRGFGGTSLRPNQSQFAHLGKHSLSGVNRTHSPFGQQNASNMTSFGSGLGLGSSFASRSPYVNSPLGRLQSTLGSATLAGDGSKSRMSHMLADLRKEGLAMPAKPIAPEWCLEHLWTEPMQTREYLETGSSGFFHTDLVGRRYMCYLLSRSAKLQLILMDGDTNVHTDGIVGSISARDAVAFPQMNMLAVLAPCGTLVLYSGATMIGKVHVGGVLSSFANLTNSFSSSFPRRSSLLPSILTDAMFDEELHTLSPVHPLQPQPTRNSGFCCGIRDPSGNRLTLVYPGGRMYRIALPLLSECPFITKCLRALQAVLTPQLSLQLLIKWYGVRNAPGAHDLNATQEWAMFRGVLLELMGRPVGAATASGSQNSSSSTTSDEPKKRRKSENCLGTDEDWEFLVRHVDGTSALGGGTAEENQQRSGDVEVLSARNNSNAPLFAYIPLVFYTLHLFYEDMKLNMRMQLHMESLAEFLYQLAVDLHLDCFSLHYFLDYPQLVAIQTGSFINDAESKKLLNRELLDGEVPSVFKCINELVVERMARRSYPYMNQVNERTWNVILLTYLIQTSKPLMYTDKDECIHTMSLSNQTAPSTLDTAAYDDDPSQTLEKRIVTAFLRMQITRRVLEQLPTAVQYLFADALEQCRIDPPIERSTNEVCTLLLRPDLLAHANFERDEAIKVEPNRTFRNVSKETSMSPKIPATPDVIPKSDVIMGDDGMELMDTKLLQLRFPNDLRIVEVRRLLASSKPVAIDIVQSLGVSDHDFIEEQEKQLFAICIRTMALPMGRGMFTLRTSTPVSTESLTIPKLCLTGKETSKGATVELQQIEVPPNMNQWPLFHNGVAAGLQITPDARDIDSTWIVYNKPKVAQDGSAEHGGFLMALGLNGHLKSLSFMSIYEYLVKSDEMTSIGLLLGISAAHRGTMDVTTTKMLSVHIEALLPATALELDIQQNIQVAAILGIGLVYQGTAKRHMAEVLLQEIGRPPGPEMENCIERESYALTAGLALGLVTLGHGESSNGLRDLHLPDTLHYYMIGGNKRTLGGSQRDKYKLPSFQVREGKTVNIDVTAPGATLALGLMFYGTGNRAVADWMKAPETSYLLDMVRPDLLLLRIIARGLILWHDIRPTDEWLWGHFPDALAFDLRHGPSEDDDEDVDHESNCQAYCNIIAGAAICLGLRYAGTEDSMALDKLKQILDLFLNMNGQYIGDYAGKTTIESCMVLVLLACSLVMAGTGNLTVMRTCRMLRARLGTTANSQVTYGSHMAIHMALGFLFLGGGRFTLRRTPEAIAALVCALFPKFPHTSNDNRYHLQAFRHLYVLAVEPRIFMPRDIDSGKLCLCKVSYERLNGERLEMRVASMAPCMLPELASLRMVEVVDDNYWPVRFERGRNWEQLETILAKVGCIDIKQKAGRLSHLDDPDRLKSLLAQTLTTEQYSCWMIDPKSLASFSHDRQAQNFTRIFMSQRAAVVESEVPKIQQPSKVARDESEIEQMVTLQFYNCLTKDRIHALPIYMSLLTAMQRIDRRANSGDIWQFKILSSIFERSAGSNGSRQMLLSPEIMRSHLDRVDLRMTAWSAKHRELLQQYLFSSSCAFMHECDGATLATVAALITFYDLPVNVMNCIEVGGAGPLNYLRLLSEGRKMRLATHTMLCMMRCLNCD